MHCPSGIRIVSMLTAGISIHICIFIIPVFAWSYGDGGSKVNSWNKKYPLCGGTNQSPIDIEKENLRFSTNLIAFDLPGYETIPRGAHWELYNNGRFLQILLNGDYKMREGGLPDEYKAMQLDFHWGSADHNGSEHLINGTQFPMELQIIHYNMKYGSYDEAIMHQDGLAAFSFLFRLKEHDNPIFTQVTNNLQNVAYRGQQVTLRPVPLLSMLPINLNNYHRYDGSLTSPPCTESVVWTIFTEYIEISAKQLSTFQKSMYVNFPSGEKKAAGGTQVKDNVRPVQPLNGRIVYSSNMADATLWTAPLSPISITLAVLLGFIILFIILGRQQRLDAEADKLEEHNEFEADIDSHLD